MNRIRSLLFRELKLSVGQYMFRLLLCMLMLFTVAAGLFVNFDAERDELYGMAYFCSYLLAIIIGIIVSMENDVHKSDLSSGWQVFSYTLPLSSFECSMANLFVKSMVIIAGVGICALDYIMVDKLIGLPLDRSVMIVFLATVDGMLLWNDIAVWFSVYIKEIKNSRKLQAALGTAAFLVTGIVLRLLPKDVSAESEGRIFVDIINDFGRSTAHGFRGFAVPLLIALLAVGMMGVKRRNERREVS